MNIIFIFSGFGEQTVVCDRYFYFAYKVDFSKLVTLSFFFFFVFAIVVHIFLPVVRKFVSYDLS